jgi:hypothetical protein
MNATQALLCAALCAAIASGGAAWAQSEKKKVSEDSPSLGKLAVREQAPIVIKEPRQSMRQGGETEPEPGDLQGFPRRRPSK